MILKTKNKFFFNIIQIGEKNDFFAKFIEILIFQMIYYLYYMKSFIK
jgi:hypothetical protein